MTAPQADEVPRNRPEGRAKEEPLQTVGDIANEDESDDDAQSNQIYQSKGCSSEGFAVLECDQAIDREGPRGVAARGKNSLRQRTLFLDAKRGVGPSPRKEQPKARPPIDGPEHQQDGRCISKNALR